MKVQVRYFASLREALGPMESVEVPAAVRRAAAPVADRPLGRAAEASRRQAWCALDQSLCDESALLEEAEVAFFPPVTGG